MRAVQYSPKYCAEAKADFDANGMTPWRWDTSHDLSLIMEDGSRVIVGHYKHAEWASRAGVWIEENTKPEDWTERPFPTVPESAYAYYPT